MLAEEGHVTAGEEVRMSGKPVRTKTKVPKVSWKKRRQQISLSKSPDKIMRKIISVVDPYLKPSPNWIQNICKFTSLGHQKPWL